VYRLNRADGRELYSVGWTSGKIAKRKQCADLKTALADARLRADQLAAGQSDAANFTIAERDEYLAAKKSADGSPLLAIVEEWKKARALAGADIMRACQTWADRHGGRTAKKATIDDVVKLFMASKKSDGVDVDAGYERTLPGFVKALGKQEIATVSPDAIAAWLSTFNHPVSKNSHRGRVVSVFRWARKRGFLPLDVMTAPERVDRAREPRGEIGLVTPEQLRAAFDLMVEKAPHYIPALTVAALCGLRRAEVHGQLWEHIDLERKLLRVSAAKPNTPAHRLVPIPDSALEWLVKHRKKSGPICANLAIDRVRDICRTAGHDLADNGLRHSWISARVVLTGNIPEVALEAGNSPRMIHSHYRELMRKDEAQAWFGVRPTSAVKVVAMDGKAVGGG
jgi:integrase